MNRKVLIQILTCLEKAIPTKATLPILSMVRIESQESLMSFVATDLDTFAETRIPNTSKNVGTGCVYLKTFLGLLKKIRQSKVDLMFDGSTLILKTGKVRFELPTISADEFPSVPVFTEETPLAKILKDELERVLDHTFYAAGLEGTRGILNSIHFILTEQYLRVVATDGRRLATSISHAPTVNRIGLLDQATKTITFLREAEAAITIPRDALVVLREAMKTEQGDVAFYNKIESDSRGGVQVGRTRIAYKKPKGEFPDYRDVIPTRPTVGFLVDKEKTIEAFELSKIALEDVTHGVEIIMEPSEWKLRTHDVNLNSEIKLPAFAKNEGSLTVKLNPDYVLDALRTLEGGQNVLVQATGPEKPVLFESGATQAVIMPMRQGI